jgi:hypothetical protein
VPALRAAMRPKAIRRLVELQLANSKRLHLYCLGLSGLAVACMQLGLRDSRLGNFALPFGRSDSRNLNGWS